MTAPPFAHPAHAAIDHEFGVGFHAPSHLDELNSSARAATSS